ncbi:MAG: glycosyltransferase family 9 protein [Candidatus Eisenbacteria sp.]|nr:glycosyltransferase family 9 protein [Candidatus Eisenbacteria bacterium]
MTTRTARTYSPDMATVENRSGGAGVHNPDSDESQPASRIPERILVLVPNKPFLGAQLVQLPFLSELRSRYPQSRITLALPFSGGSIFEEFRFQNELVGGYMETTRRTLQFLVRCAAHRHDCVYSLRARSARTGLAALVTGARRRIGFGVPGNRFFFNEIVGPREDAYLALKYMDLLEGGRQRVTLPRVDLWTTEIALSVTALFVERGIHSPCVGIVAGAGGRKKRWPIPRFLALEKEIRDRFPEVTVLYFLSRGEAEGEIGESLAQVDPRHKFCLEDLRSLACALSRCTVLVSSDCGPAHFGHLLGMPQVTLFDGDGRPGEWFLARDGAVRVVAEGGQPISSIEVEEVVEVVCRTVGFGLR